MAERAYDPSYDILSYPSHPYWFTHPDHLAVLARLYGMSPAPLESCRILELGCASGGNILPIAASLPGARVVAVELSAEQSRMACEAAEAAGVVNIALHHLSLTEIGRDFGQFDYIIGHGLYSWVKPGIRRHLLHVCAEHLAPQGVVYLSFNVFPGWAQAWALRHMMRFHTADEGDPRRKEVMALELLERIVAATAPTSTEASYLGRELAFLKAQQPGYLAHDHLEEENNPVFFHEFMAEAEPAGLAYLATAFRELMWPELWPKGLAEVLVAQGDPVRQQQYLDFVGSARFRAVLLRHAGAPRLADPDPGALEGLWLRASDIGRRVPLDGNAGRPGMLGSASQVVPLGTAAVEAAVRTVLEAKPRSLPWSTVLAAAQETPEGIEDLPADLLRLYMHGCLDLSAHDPTPHWPPDAERPRISRLNRTLAERQGWMVDPWHRRGVVDAMAQRLVRVLDGSLTPDEVVAVMQGEVERGEMTLGTEWADAHEMVSSGLVGLARRGFLVSADAPD